MGRDVTGLRNKKKSSPVNVKSSGTIRAAVHVAPKAVPEHVETKEFEPEDHTVKGRIPDKGNEKQDVLGVKSTNHEPREKIIRAEPQKSSDKKLSSPVKPVSDSAVNETVDTNFLEPSILAERKTSPMAHAIVVETNDSAGKCSPKSNDLHSPKTARKSQPNTLSVSRKQSQSYDKKYYDEEDNWSLASSTATSRTVKSKVTVPVAPRFTCVDRLERRKEFYAKLEEKHKALEKEKLEYEARTKEEEQSTIKQLRKSMTYKANPVPSFYREGPPPKVELKKLPVTRAKSPNLTRRKSCSDAAKPSPEDKGIRARATRHSVGVYKEGRNSPITPKSKERAGVRKSNGTIKVKDQPGQLKETTESSQVKEQGNADIAGES